MKKLSNSLFNFALLASFLVLAASCTDEDEPGVGQTSFVIEGTDDVRETTVNVGETVAFNMVMNVPEGFNNLVVNQTVDGNTEVYDRDERDPGVETNDFTYEFEYTPDAAVAGEMVIFDFIVVDEAGAESSYEYTVNVMQQEVTAYNTVLLMAPTSSQTNEVWFSTSTGERYATDAVNDSEEALSAEIDFGYRHGPNAGATLASPAQYPSEGGQDLSAWTERNNTMLRRTAIEPSEFLEQGQDVQFIIDAYEAGTEGSNPEVLTDLEAGDVLAFQTDSEKEGGAKHGLIHVEAIDMGADGTGYGSDASITLNVRVID